MDFVVLGFGIGAFTILLGLALRNLGPWLRRVRQGQELSWSQVTRRVAWGRACRAAGLVTAIAGGVLCFGTLVALVGRASDATGALVVFFVSAAALLASVAWALVYARQQPRLPQVFPAKSAPPRPVPTMNLSPSPPLRRRGHRQPDIDDRVPATGAPAALSRTVPETDRVAWTPVDGAVGSSADEGLDASAEPVTADRTVVEGDSDPLTTADVPLQEEQNAPRSGEAPAGDEVPPAGASSEFPSEQNSPKVPRPLVDTPVRARMGAGLGSVSPSHRTR